MRSEPVGWAHTTGPADVGRERMADARPSTSRMMRSSPRCRRRRSTNVARRRSEHRRRSEDEGTPVVGIVGDGIARPALVLASSRMSERGGTSLRDRRRCRNEAGRRGANRRGFRNEAARSPGIAGDAESAGMPNRGSQVRRRRRPASMPEGPHESPRTACRAWRSEQDGVSEARRLGSERCGFRRRSRSRVGPRRCSRSTTARHLG